MPPFSQTCVSSYSPVQLTSTEALRTFLAQVSHANPFPLPESNSAQTIPATCGPQQSRSSAVYAQPSLFSKTSPDFCPVATLDKSLRTWPRAGMTRNGEFWQLPTWERRIVETGSGLLPTPRTVDGQKDMAGQNRPIINGRVIRESGHDFGLSLGTMASRGMWPTPRAHETIDLPKGTRPGNGADNLATTVARMFATQKARDWKGQTQRGIHAPMDGLPNLDNGEGKVIGGKLNPTWVEWLMGWPLEWTALKPLAMDKYLSWLQQHGIS